MNYLGPIFSDRKPTKPTPVLAKVSKATQAGPRARLQFDQPAPKRVRSEITQTEGLSPLVTPVATLVTPKRIPKKVSAEVWEFPKNLNTPLSEIPERLQGKFIEQELVHLRIQALRNIEQFWTPNPVFDKDNFLTPADSEIPSTNNPFSNQNFHRNQFPVRLGN